LEVLRMAFGMNNAKGKTPSGRVDASYAQNQHAAYRQVFYLEWD